MAEKETDKQVEEKFFGLIGTMILDDMSKNSEMLQKLTGQIEYDRGFMTGVLKRDILLVTDRRKQIFVLRNSNLIMQWV
jgi:hypothetical protein